MTKQLPCLNAIIPHASVWINLEPVVISDPVDSPPRSHYIWPKKDDIAAFMGFFSHLNVTSLISHVHTQTHKGLLTKKEKILDVFYLVIPSKP